MVDSQDSRDDPQQVDGLLDIAGMTTWLDEGDYEGHQEEIQYSTTSTALSTRQDTALANTPSTSQIQRGDVKRMVESTEAVMTNLWRSTDEFWESIERNLVRLDELEIRVAELSRRNEVNLPSGFAGREASSGNAQTSASGADQPSPDYDQAECGDAASEADSDLSRASSPTCGSVASSDSDEIPLHEHRLAESDIVLIQTTDGNILPAPRLLLTKYVTFFADLPPFLDATSDHADSPPPLELPSATSGGMGLVIGLLRAKYLGEDTDEDPFDPERELYFEDLQRIVDALLIADIYDIPVIPAIFAQTSYDSIDAYPLWAWVLGTLAGGHPCIDFPSLIVDTLQVETHQLSPEARAILHRYVPDALAVLEADQARWMGMTDKLLAEWTFLAPMSTGINRYTLKCLGRTKRYTKDGPGCLTRRAEPDWHKLRKEVAEGAFEAGLSGGQIYSWSVKKYINAHVRCDTCATRLHATFGPALVAFEDQCPPRCELQWYCETCYYDAPKDYWVVDGPLVSAWTKKNPGVKKRALYWPYKVGEVVF